jgi:3-hydroxyacyl-CoA dehydrogenase
MIGLDTSLSILENLNRENKEIYIPDILKEMVKKGNLGYKNKKILRL